MKRFCRMAALASLACGTPVRASDADSAATDFSLRLPAALGRFSAAGDVAGFGGASAGSRYPTGANPASIDWELTAGQPWYLASQWSSIHFDRAPNLDVTALTLGRSTGTAGTFQLSAVQIGNDGSTAGDFLLLEGDYAQIQWGRKFSDSLAAGLNVNYMRLGNQFGLQSMLLGESDSGTRTLRAGVLWAVSAKLMAGVVVDHADTHSNAKQFDASCFCFLQFGQNSESNSVRAGLSYQYAELSSIYVDYLHLSLRNPLGSLVDRTVFMGIEHRVIPGFYIRGGMSHGKGVASGATFGLGIAPSSHWTFDVAYQREMFPQLTPEFGKSKLINLSLSISL